MMSFEALSDTHCISKHFLSFSRPPFEEPSLELIDFGCPIDPLVIVGGLGVAMIFFNALFQNLTVIRLRLPEWSYENHIYLFLSYFPLNVAY